MQDVQEVFDSLREDAAALLEGFDTHQLAAIAQFLTRATDFAYRRAALLRAQLLSAGGHPRAASNPDLNQQRGVAMNDDEQLIALFERMCRAWTEGDAQAYGSCFTPDCDYVSFDGTRARGRALMVESHDKLFRGVLFGTALVGEVESIRHLSHDVALVHGTGSVLVAWRSRLPKRRLTRNTIVALRTPEGWRFTATHNGRVRPVTVPEPDSFPSRTARVLVRASGALGIGRAGATEKPAVDAMH